MKECGVSKQAHFANPSSELKRIVYADDILAGEDIEIAV